MANIVSGTAHVMLLQLPILIKNCPFRLELPVSESSDQYTAIVKNLKRSKLGQFVFEQYRSNERKSFEWDSNQNDRM